MKGIIFINGGDLIKYIKPYDLLLKDDGFKALYNLHLLPQSNDDIFDLWESLRDEERFFFGKNTIRNEVTEAVNNFYVAAMKIPDIVERVKNICYFAYDHEVIARLDNVEDKKIQKLYHDFINKEKLYDKFCVECVNLSKRISKELSSSEYDNPRKEVVLKNCKKRCSLEKIVNLANSHDYAVGILAEGDSSVMTDVYKHLFPEAQEVIVVPHEDYGGYKMDDSSLYHSIRRPYELVVSPSISMNLVDNHKINVEAAKKARWNTALIEIKDSDGFLGIEEKLMIEVSNFINNQEKQQEHQEKQQEQLSVQYVHKR